LDLSGNVWEWCLNEYAKPQHTGPGGEESRVLRGGSWGNDPGVARAGFRVGYRPGNRYDFIGFRVVCSSPLAEH
jgi:formylglycine-generating enzyme required for sulfatase activity